MSMLKHLRTLFCLIILLYITAQISFANSGFTLTGGYNMSKIKFKDNNNPLGNLDNKYKGGFNIGLEKHIGNLIVGASFLQRGSKLKDSFSFTSGIEDIYEIPYYDSYNYGAVHLLFSTNLGYGFEGLGGIEGYTCANRAVYILQSGVIKYAWGASPNPGVEPDYDEIKSTLQNL